MQRAFTARTENEARQVPLWAGFGKLVFSLIVVLPGLAAYRLLPDLGAAHRFDQALPAMMTLLYGPTTLGLGLTALAASLMSGLAANVSAFAAIWTEDIYRAHVRPRKSGAHYLLLGRISTLAAILVSVLASYLNFLFSNLMDHVQLIFSVLRAPFWAIFLLGMGTRRTTERGAITGFISGAMLSFVHSIAVKAGLLHYGSVMSANFYTAIYAFCTAVCVGWLASRTEELPMPVTAMAFDWQTGFRGEGAGLLWALSAVLLLGFFVLNVVWR